MTDMNTTQNKQKETLADLYIAVGKSKTLTPLEKRRFRKFIWKFMQYHE